MRISKHVVFLALFWICVFFLFFLYLFSHLSRPSSEVPFSFSVTDHFGITVETESLLFGGIPRGASTTRSLTVQGPPHSELFIISTHPWVQPTTRFLSLGNDAHTTLSVRASIPRDAPFGNYTGKLKIFVR